MWQVVRSKPKVQKEDGKGFSVIIEFELDPGYVPLVMAAISNWQGQRLYLAARYNGAVESLLHHSSIGGLLWSSRSFSVEGKRTQEFHGGV